MANNIIRQIDNGVEFFTIESTGESGMSKSGLARLCGVTRQSITDLLAKAVSGKTKVESLEPLQGKNIELQSNSTYKNSDIIADWVCGCVIEYYAMDAKEVTPEAKRAMRSFRDIGIRATIQKITGWQQEDPTIAIYQQHHEQCRQQFLADSHRVELRNQLKAYRKNLNATIKAHFDRLNKVTPQSTYWKVADGLNLALTSETAKQMRSRTGLDSSQLIGDYMAERPLWFYTLAITVTTNLILCDRMPPLEAIKKAPELALPKDYRPKQIELVDPVKALEKRIDLYLSGQLTLPIPNTKVLAIA